MKKMIMLFVFGILAFNAKSQTVVAVPYHEDFETALGAGKWKTYDLNSDDGNWFYADQTYGAIGYQQSYCFAYIYSYMNPADDWLVSPGLYLTSGVNYTISFKYAEFDSTKTEKLEVFIGNDSLPANFTNVIVDYDSINSETFKTCSYSFTPGSTGNYYVGFHAYSDVNQGAILIDEFDVSGGSSLNSIASPLINVSIFPNPSSDYVIVNNISDSKIIISDITGNLIYSGICIESKKVIDIRNFSKGVYFIHVEKNGYQKSQKLIAE